jgi:hypothetical protein
MSTNLPDPATAPGGFIVDLLGRYFPPGYVESLIRTWVPVGLGSLLAWAAVHWHIVVGPRASATIGVIAAGLVVAGYYALARLVERRWPALGRWLIALNLVKTAAPVYVRPNEAVRVIDNTSGQVRRE